MGMSSILWLTACKVPEPGESLPRPKVGMRVSPGIWELSHQKHGIFGQASCCLDIWRPPGPPSGHPPQHQENHLCEGRINLAKEQGQHDQHGTCPFSA